MLMYFLDTVVLLEFLSYGYCKTYRIIFKPLQEKSYWKYNFTKQMMLRVSIASSFSSFFYLNINFTVKLELGFLDVNISDFSVCTATKRMGKIVQENPSWWPCRFTILHLNLLFFNSLDLPCIDTQGLSTPREKSGTLYDWMSIHVWSVGHNQRMRRIFLNPHQVPNAVLGLEYNFTI